MALMARREQQVAVEIGSDTIKVAAVVAGRGGLTLRAAATTPTPEGAVVDGVVESPEELGASLHGLLVSADISWRNAAAAVGGPRVVVRPVRFPHTSRGRLARLVCITKSDYLS